MGRCQVFKIDVISIF